MWIGARMGEMVPAAQWFAIGASLCSLLALLAALWIIVPRPSNESPAGVRSDYRPVSYYGYVATRYAGQDAGWPGSPSATGSQLVPWAAEQYLEWATNDPVSWKERLRNGAVYVIQNNRNPFVDHPEFVAMIYDSNAVAGVGELPATRTIQLRQNLPNPFASRTSIGFDLARPASVTLTVFDVTGRAVRVLAAGAAMEAGRHHAEWDGRDDAGTPLGAGLYFCRLEAGAEHAMRRMVFVR